MLQTYRRVKQVTLPPEYIKDKGQEQAEYQASNHWKIKREVSFLDVNISRELTQPRDLSPNREDES
jgi:hypothetical protein